MTLEDAEYIISNYADKEDFIAHHCRVTNQEGDDNSIELAGYWEEANKMVNALSKYIQSSKVK